ncbi:MAG: hypothetical protein B7Y50_12605 [Hydrogenophilales bacterium 28-61-11]|nr:MAG: hypothetical protein B7Y50_12605 [Hydrogenophilales bacterium 28-61-11]
MVEYSRANLPQLPERKVGRTPDRVCALSHIDFSAHKRDAAKRVTKQGATVRSLPARKLHAFPAACGQFYVGILYVPMT